MLQPENTDDKSALLCLPDDALIQILGYLDRKTQLMLTEMHIRFLTIMPNIWRSRYRSVNITPTDGSYMIEKDFRFFIGSLQNTLNLLWMQIEMKEQFEILVNFVFPKLHDFSFITNLGNFCDADMSKMIKAFPNLRTFSPQGCFTGKYFERFHHLEHLTLTHCRTFEVSYLIRILEIRRLKTLKLGVFERNKIQDIDLPLDGTKSLEVLQCNNWEMRKWFLERLKHLTHLQQITFCGHVDSDLLKSVLLSANRSRVKSLEINTRSISPHEFYSVLDLNIQFETLKVKGSIVILIGFLPYLEKVRQIHFINCFFIGNSAFQILLRLKSPEILTLDECYFSFKDYTFVVNDIAKGRSKTLHLYLDSATGASRFTELRTEVVWKTEGEHELFQLHKKKLEISKPPEGVSIFFG
ncbi:uncharacterized protein [Drosophila kikkawai]|uniref:F-box domain-containing protein n=1 Tax=Drosophila kikkawai TaxID=30033 RepID=A0A6P4JFH7_DROKI|nr:uncharacterized protein LOC108082456 isoform X2 [Drosophila kikkawai]